MALTLAPGAQEVYIVVKHEAVKGSFVVIEESTKRIVDQGSPLTKKKATETAFARNMLAFGYGGGTLGIVTCMSSTGGRRVVEGDLTYYGGSTCGTRHEAYGECPRAAEHTSNPDRRPVYPRS